MTDQFSPPSIAQSTTLATRRTNTLINLTDKLITTNTVKGICEMTNDELWAWWCSLSDEWKNLFIHNYDAISKTGILNELKMIDSVMIGIPSDIDISNLEPITKLNNVKRLRFYDADSEHDIDLKSISLLTNLETLELSWVYGSRSFYYGFEKIYNLKFLENLKKLRNFSVYGLINDFSILSNMHNLEVLDIYAHNATDFSFLKKLKFINSLIIRNISMKNNLSLCVTNNILLSHLELLSCNLKNIEFIENLKNLQELNLRNNFISDLEPLRYLKDLNKLSLMDNNISDIYFLGKLKNLKKLWLNNNNISNIYSLSELENLELLDLRNNKISNIEPIFHLKKLKTLIVENNLIKNEDLELLRSINPDCDIYLEASCGFLTPW